MVPRHGLHLRRVAGGGGQRAGRAVRLAQRPSRHTRAGDSRSPHHRAVRAGDGRFAPQDRCPRTGPGSRRTHRSHLQHLKPGGRPGPRRDSSDPGRDSRRGRFPVVGDALPGTGSGYGSLPLGPLQRRADCRCGQQSGSGRSDGDGHLLPRCHPRAVHVGVRAAAHTGHVAVCTGCAGGRAGRGTPRQRRSGRRRPLSAGGEPADPPVLRRRHSRLRRRGRDRADHDRRGDRADTANDGDDVQRAGQPGGRGLGGQGVGGRNVLRPGFGAVPDTEHHPVHPRHGHHHRAGE